MIRFSVLVIFLACLVVFESHFHDVLGDDEKEGDGKVYYKGDDKSNNTSKAYYHNGNSTSKAYYGNSTGKGYYDNGNSTSTADDKGKGKDDDNKGKGNDDDNKGKDDDNKDKGKDDDNKGKDDDDKGKTKVLKNGLAFGFYDETCPEAEDIVRDIISSKVKGASALPAQLLRLLSHDCFVRGCDASVMLDPVPGKNDTEKLARPNLSLVGFEVIDEIKAKLEQICPGVVSCADILVLSARDAVSLPFKRDLWEVPTGRRDGLISLQADASRDVPSPFQNFTSLKQLFARKTLDVVDLVALSGAHTIGVAHCGPFAKRLYNFTGVGDADPSLDPAYAADLRKRCPNPLKVLTTTVAMDPHDSDLFNNHYYRSVMEGRGLFVSDASLLTDKEARAAVEKMKKNPFNFFKQFAKSVEKMGAIEVLTGTAGQIRKKCRLVN